MSIAYGIMLAVAVALLIMYCSLIKNKQPWLLILYSSVCVVNLGYLLLSISQSVQFALWSNVLAYLGQIFLLMSMFMTIIKLCGFRYNKALPITLICIGAVFFTLILTTGFYQHLPLYYTDAWIDFVDGGTLLEKSYGPLHPAYLVYVILYFLAMIGAIISSLQKKLIASQKQAGLLTASVVCNIAVWIVEKFIPLNFEFLSVSYILSVSMLFFLYWMMQDYVPKKNADNGKTKVVFVDSASKAEKIQRVLDSLPDGKTLTSRQMEMLSGILDGKSQKEIASDLHISENTVKWHMGLLYSTLNVKGKDEIFMLIK